MRVRSTGATYPRREPGVLDAHPVSDQRLPIPADQRLSAALLLDEGAVTAPCDHAAVDRLRELPGLTRGGAAALHRAGADVHLAQQCRLPQTQGDQAAEGAGLRRPC